MDDVQVPRENSSRLRVTEGDVSRLVYKKAWARRRPGRVRGGGVETGRLRTEGGTRRGGSPNPNEMERHEVRLGFLLPGFRSIRHPARTPHRKSARPFAFRGASATFRVVHCF